MGTQIDIDIYSDRIEIVSPGSWLLPRDYAEYPVGSILSIRRNTIIAACLDVANLMERGGTGFQTMIECYQGCSEDIQPVVSIYPGFLNLRLFDKLYKEALINTETEELTNAERIIAILSTEGSKSVKELQEALNYNNRGHFLKNVLNPMLEEGVVIYDN